jgi:cytochrome c556
MKNFVPAALLFVLAASAAFADAHSDRQAVMRSNNQAVQALRPLAAAYDAAAVKAQGQVLVDNAAKIKAAFAPGTDQNDPGALPAVWTDAAGFAAAADKFGTDAQAVMAAADGPALTAALQTLQGDCGACHRTYRVPPAPRPAAAPAQ